MLEDTGRFLFGLVETAGRGVVLFLAALREMKHLHRNLDKFIQQAFLCGIAAIPVVAITGMFSGMVIAAQTGETLRRFGLAELTLGPIVGGSLLRELGPVLAAICVAGFVGGGMASVIATMRVNEEIDALEVMSINPIRYLIMPRLAAMMLVLPVLSLFASLLGIFGGAVVARYQIGVPYAIYFDNLKWLMAVRDVLFGVIKAFVFAIIITVVSCEQGYNASGGAEGVGLATMRAVVYSFLLILVANYLLFSLVFLTLFTWWLK